MIALRCVLCGRDLPADDLKRVVSRDYIKGAPLVVLICVDSSSCIDAAAKRSWPP